MAVIVFFISFFNKNKETIVIVSLKSKSAVFKAALFWMFYNFF